MRSIFLRLLLLSFIISCEVKNETTDVEDPSELEILIDNISDGSGLVIVQASAKNAIEFQFFMGEHESEEPYASLEGYYEHIYSSFSSYLIEVRAYGKSGRYIKKTKQIVVPVGDIPTVGEGYTTPISYGGMDLVWTDEFDGDTLNLNNWNYDNGTGCPDLCGWGNNELEFYRNQNVSVGEGLLTIVARKENYEGSAYTSGKIVSRALQNFTYGRIDIRALLPKGQGIWPALWMLGANHQQLGWPKCGEIDIMEMIGGQGRENTVHGNMFWFENGTVDQVGQYQLDSGTFNDVYHVFTLQWDEQTIHWYVDDIPFHQISIADETKEAFHKPFYFIMNIAVGGNWPGSPNQTTIFPTQMNVDYIRVFQNK